MKKAADAGSSEGLWEYSGFLSHSFIPDPALQDRVLLWLEEHPQKEYDDEYQNVLSSMTKQLKKRAILLMILILTILYPNSMQKYMPKASNIREL